MVELLIVMLIGAILTTSIIAVFVHQTRAMALQEDLVDLEENLRAALSILHRDVRTAGLGLIAQNQSFFIGNLDLNADGVADNVYTNNPLASDHANQVFKPDAMRVKYAHPEEDGILISSYNGAASQMQVCGPSGLNDGDVFLVMTPSSPPKIRALEVSSFNTNCTDAACPNSDCDKIVFAPGPSELNTAGGAGAAYVGGKVVLTTNIYYLGNDAGGNPAMFRVSNYQLPHAIIAFGVVDFQVEYGVPLPTRLPETRPSTTRARRQWCRMWPW